ncbi:sterol desaturase family protein [Salinimicrobium flavum]|uniref:Sterol desaturase family protein n=1 Tax=Salinimicrobium flavum TaxID=1737065 RepID=A0ABW5J1H1_9FLAO
MMPELNSPGLFLVYLIIFFLVILVRYFIAAGIFYYYYYFLKAEEFREKRLSRRGWKKGQFKNEMIWSTWSSVIFAFFGTLLYWLWQEGFTAIYLDPRQYGIWYLPVSLALVLFLHETYYYWVHRLMHHPKVYRTVHKVHHDSLTPTPWTAFSFHPWESLLEAIILPLILLFLPVNIYVLGLYLLIMTLSSVVNHLDIEIYPAGFQKSKFGKQFIGATHHHYHHSEFMTNYGLYFTFWDKWMGTESEKMK